MSAEAGGWILSKRISIGHAITLSNHAERASAIAAMMAAIKHDDALLRDLLGSAGAGAGMYIEHELVRDSIHVISVNEVGGELFDIVYRVAEADAA